MDWALGDAVRLGEDAPGSDVAQYFTWENQYDSQSSKIDSFVERPVRDGPWSARVSGREAPRAVGC